MKPLGVPMRLVTKGSLRILDFDCEARPLSWYGGDWVTKEPTAIAWAWVDPENPRQPLGECQVMLLGEPARFPTLFGDYLTRPTVMEDILDAFVEAYDEADIVTGHFIRGYDLGLVNGALIEYGRPPLKPKLTQDTKGDLIRFSGLSKSQENLGALLGLEHPKVGMNQKDWRSANRLEADGIERTRDRVVGDVVQHIELRAALLERGMLSAPKPWSSGSQHAPEYHP